MHVRALVRSVGRAARLARFPVDLVSGEVEDAEAVGRAAEGCSVIFHCAPDAVRRGRLTRRRAEGTRTVAEVARASGVDRLVHVSSFAAYGPTPEGDLVEWTPWAPSRHPLTRTTRAAESHVRRMHREHRLPTVIVQPTVVYGPYSEDWTHCPLADLAAGRLGLPHGGSVTCNAVYVDDVVDVLLRAAHRPGAVGSTFLVSAARPTTWRAFFGAYEAMLGQRSIESVDEHAFRRLLERHGYREAAREELQRLVAHPEVRASLRRLLPGRAGPSVRDRRGAGRTRAAGRAPVAPRRTDTSGGSPRRIPRQALPWTLLRHQTVHVDKARRILGYEPRYDLERGMERTARYADWAGLTPS